MRTLETLRHYDIRTVRHQDMKDIQNVNAIGDIRYITGAEDAKVVQGIEDIQNIQGAGPRRLEKPGEAGSSGNSGRTDPDASYRYNLSSGTNPL